MGARFGNPEGPIPGGRASHDITGAGEAPGHFFKVADPTTKDKVQKTNIDRIQEIFAVFRTLTNITENHLPEHAPGVLDTVPCLKVL